MEYNVFSIYDYFCNHVKIVFLIFVLAKIKFKNFIFSITKRKFAFFKYLKKLLSHDNTKNYKKINEKPHYIRPV